MEVLGMEWQNSAQGHWESESEDRKHGEKTASTIEGKPEIASGFL
jgi:putative transposase